MSYTPHLSYSSQNPSYQLNRNNNNIANKIQSLDVDCKDKREENFRQNEKYFRPSKYPAININDFNNFIFNLYPDDLENIILPDSFTNSAPETVLNFFSILREANQGAAMTVGCGSVGNAIAPYPIAYAFLSTELHHQISYQQFLNLFKNIYHINLIANIPLNNSDCSESTCLFLVEIETLEGNSFNYYYGYLEVKEEKSQYKINSLTYDKQDFFCAAYHGWQYNAELIVAFMYGDWCNLIEKQYPTQQNKNKKKIMIDGTDGNQYMFVFFELTNGTDIAIGQYIKSASDCWIPVSINPYQCLDQNK